MVTRTDYTSEKVEAARRVIIELMHLLKHYYNDIAIIGGWVPDLTINNKSAPYTGSMDVDVAINHKSIDDAGYRNIQELLTGAGYSQGHQPFIYLRTVIIDGREIEVQVDLLSGVYDGTGRSHRHQQAAGIMARKVKGCDVVFDIPANEKEIEGILPNGGLDSVSVRIASVVPFIVMKGIALDERIKEKDAWDIYYYISNYPDGLDGIIKEFSPFLENKLVQDGLQKLNKHFKTLDNIGPKFVADFEEISDREERERIQRDAFEKVDYLLSKLGFRPF